MATDTKPVTTAKVGEPAPDAVEPAGQFWQVRLERVYEVQAPDEQTAMFMAIHEGHEFPHENGTITAKAVGDRPLMLWAYDPDELTKLAEDDPFNRKPFELEPNRTEQLTRDERDERATAAAELEQAQAADRQKQAAAAAKEFPFANMPAQDNAEAAQRRQVADGNRTAAVAAPGSAAPSSSATASGSSDEHNADLKGKLPDDFPGKTALEAAGITTYAQARKQDNSAEGLAGVAGIGDATAAKIHDALVADTTD